MQLRTLLVNGCLLRAELLLMPGLRLKQLAPRGRVLLHQVVGGRGNLPALPSNLLRLPRLLLVGLLREIRQPLIGRVTPGQYDQDRQHREAAFENHVANETSSKW